MARKVLVTLCLVLAVALRAMAAGETGSNLIVVEDGRSVCTVVIPRDTDRWTRQAAEWLKEYVRKATGAELEIVSEDAPKEENQPAHSGRSPAGAIISVGHTRLAREAGIDGETWREFLAAHLGEPVRNYGIGGYSVYQAYLRMLREEPRAPARYIIFNVFDDDHYRNLHGWQRIRFGVNRKATNPTVPYVIVDPEKGKFVERPKPCPTPESVYQLCDLEASGLFALIVVQASPLVMASGTLALRSLPSRAVGCGVRNPPSFRPAKRVVGGSRDEPSKPCTNHTAPLRFGHSSRYRFGRERWQLAELVGR